MAIRVETLTREAAEARLDELAQLLLDAHASGMALGLAAPLSHEGARAAYADTAAKLAPHDHLLLAAFDGDEVVGAVQLERSQASNGRHRAEIRRLAVRAERRGAGIGRALLEAAAGEARRLGLRLLWLSTHEGTDADTVYARLGWTRVGVIPDYAELPTGDLAGNAFYFLRLSS